MPTKKSSKNTRPDNHNKALLYPIDQLLAEVVKIRAMAGTRSWEEKGGYSFPSLEGAGAWIRELLPILAVTAISTGIRPSSDPNERP